MHIIINYLYAGGQISAGRGCQDGFKDRGQFAPAAQLLGAQVATFSISPIVFLVFLGSISLTFDFSAPQPRSTGG